jgi:glycosyltransferase involved in cell wall biosynthesis
MPRPRITIITPCLNQAPFIERTICSVLDQGYENLEFMVVDGGSTDGSLEIIQQYKGELALFVGEPDQGPADAINKALSRATGEIVGFLNGDDLYLPGALDAAARAMRTPTVQWVVGHAVQIGPDDERIADLRAALPRSIASFLMHDSGVLPWPASFFRREFIERNGRVDGRLMFAFDYELACRLLTRGHEPVIVAPMLAAHRVYAHSRTAQNTVQQGREYIAAARRYGESLPLAQRCSLWRNCDNREQIYTLAEAEMHSNDARRFLMHRILRRPWWVAQPSLRHALLHGVPQTPAEPARPAA